MARSKAPTVREYLAQLPPDRRAAIAAVRKVIRANLPAGYRESMGWGMISYGVPLSVYPDTYNKQPLCLAALASRKNYCTLYLMGVYADPAQLEFLRESFQKAELKLSMGKSCVHFQTPQDLPLPAIGKLIRAATVRKYVAQYEAARAGLRRRTGPRYS